MHSLYKGSSFEKEKDETSSESEDDRLDLIPVAETKMGVAPISSFSEHNATISQN
jgi:hypothetical protein